MRDELEALSIQSKLRTSASGRISGGRPFARGALYLMLQNRIYRGEIVHNQQSYLGEHEPPYRVEDSLSRKDQVEAIAPGRGSGPPGSAHMAATSGRFSPPFPRRVKNRDLA